MNFKHWLALEDRQLYFDFMKVPEISWEQSKNMFGPVWHGTSDESKENINNVGFRLTYGDANSGDVRNGYGGDAAVSYGTTGIPAPVHHLGYGIYFTTKKSVAKQYANNNTKNMLEYYLDIPRLETINFGAPNTMMKWWIKNGYNIKELIDKKDPNARINATINLTNNLKKQYDAVWFTAKSMFGALLDGDQICVFDPHRIYKLNINLGRMPNSILPGDRVLLKTGHAVNILNSRTNNLGEKLFEIKFSNKKQAEEISNKLKSIYWNRVKNDFMKVPDVEGIIQRMMDYKQGDRETAINDRVEYHFEPSRLKLNFPEEYIKEVIPKGQRISKK